LAEASPDSTVGSVLDGRYRIDARLGDGGMGAVYRAHQLRAGRDVAIKVLHPALSAERGTLERFENEARVIANLRHPNTLKLIDVGRLPDGRVFFVSELVEGETVAELLARGEPLARTVEILRQVAEALAEAHGRGIVHRDLKPSNIMVERVGTKDVAKVLDFGIAKLADRPGITATGAIFGTPAYMSPEQARGDPIDHRTDIYSLGVLLYRVAAGRMPFGAKSSGALLVKHMTEEPPPPSEVGADVPPALEDLILHMLEKDPADRPESIEEVAIQLARPDLLEISSSLDILPGSGPESTRASPPDGASGPAPASSAPAGSPPPAHFASATAPPTDQLLRTMRTPRRWRTVGLGLVLAGAAGAAAWWGTWDVVPRSRSGAASPAMTPEDSAVEASSSGPAPGGEEPGPRLPSGESAAASAPDDEPAAPEATGAPAVSSSPGPNVRGVEASRPSADGEAAAETTARDAERSARSADRRIGRADSPKKASDPRRDPRRDRRAEPRTDSTSRKGAEEPTSPPVERNTSVPPGLRDVEL